MTMTVTQSVITIAAVVLGTMTTRFLPFLVFPEGREPPAFIRYLGAVLPYAVIGLLLVYCLKDAVFTSYHALPELIAITVTAALQRWKRNMLLSLFAGTALYMLLVHRTFNVSPADIRGTKRNANVASARRVAIYILREVTGM